MESPKVIYEDEYLLAINKPSGWDVEVLREWLKENYDYPTSQEFVLRAGIVHRLDKPTSGVILVAKTKKVFEDLQKEFFDRVVEKTYVALVHGKVDPPEGEINAPVGRLPWKRTKFGVLRGGREAVTRYKMLKYQDGMSLVELYPKTGRTHQLRVHLKHIGHPIVSDPLYAGRKTLREDLKKFPRLMLHAKLIKFTHPTTKERLLIEAPLPSELTLL